nr:acidic leucine-rich nuclear phosphoprotein 32 family member A [Tanacetum cinerariifolium]
PSPQPGQAESTADRSSRSSRSSRDTAEELRRNVDEDDDITDDEDALPHDLAYSDNEDLINFDDMSAYVARSHGGDMEERIAPSTPCKGKRKPILGGREAFEMRDKQTIMPLGDHAAHWSSYIGEVIRGVPLYYPSWLKVPKERKAALITDIGRSTSVSSSTCKKRTIPTRLLSRPDIRNIARAAQNRQNRTKSTVISQQGSRSLARLRDEMRQSSTTQEYPPLIDTFFVAHTVNGEFLWDEDRRIYEEMRRLETTSTDTNDEINRLARGGKQRGHILGVGRVLLARATASPSTPTYESTLNSLHKKVDFMMSLFKSDLKYSDMFSQFESGGASGSSGCGDEEEGTDHQDDEDEDEDGDGDT